MDPVGRPDDIAIYARRKARMAFLRLHLEEAHPVVVTESHLVEMAASKLTERLLAELGEDGLAHAQTAIEAEVREAMRRTSSSLVSDSAGRARLRASMDSEPLRLFRPRTA